MADIHKMVRKIIEYNTGLKPELLKPSKGILRHPYLSAGSGDSYPDLTDWDSIWSGMGYMKLGDPVPLRDTLINMLEHVQPDGKGQRRIGYKKYSAQPYQIRPFLACGVYALSREIGTDWLNQASYDKLHLNLLYWHIHRMGREGLLKWLHVDEGFADNGLCNFAWDSLSVQGVDLNCQLIREHLAMSRVAKMMNDDARAEEHQDYADRLIHRVNASLWDEQDGFYYSLYNPAARHEPSQFIQTKGYNNLWPLWIGITPIDRAKHLIENYVLNTEEFRSMYGIRSASKSDRFYNNMTHGMTSPMTGAPQTGPVMHSWCSNWQGPIWTVPNWLCIMALKRYGYTDAAMSLTEDYLGLICAKLDEHGVYHENYDAETGEALKAKGIGSWYVMLPQILEDSDDAYFPGV